MSGNYDVIVVGGGSAGSVIAGRLATETDADVLLLEEGGWDINPLIHIPGGFPKLAERGWYMYQYASVPQEQLDGKSRKFFQGRGMGGGGTVNSMAYVRGQPEDYDAWNEMAGGEGGWSFDEILPHFLEMEGNTAFANEHHGAEGPLTVSMPGRINPLNRAAMRGYQEAGLPYNHDYNGLEQRGVSPVQVTIGNGKRCSAARAYLHPAKKQPNLTVLPRARVEHLMHSHGEIVGVEFVRFGRRQRARAAQVVVSAGGFASPKLLMLSGIGPEDELARHGIRTRISSPEVGQNLQDHPKVPFVANVRKGLGYARDLSGIKMLVDGLVYLLLRDGPAASNGFESVAYSNPDNPKGSPTIQTYHAPLGAGGGPWGLKNPDWGLTLLNVVLQPQSRGTLRLRDGDPRSHPIIDPNWFSEPEDLRKMIGALRYSRDVLATEALNNIDAFESAPGTDKQSDEDLIQYCRAAVDTMWHAAGTCRMGGDNESVVDPQLRVRGVNGLRVVDSSVIPSLPSANINGPVMAIASKGVDFIKEDLSSILEARR